MNSIRRNTTLKSIQRSTTFKTIQRSATTAKNTINRAGTGAWHWINADDTEVSKARPVGISYFQRNDTFRRINAAESKENNANNKFGHSLTIGRRKTTRSTINTIRRKPRPAETLPLYSSDSRYNKNAYYANLDDMNGVYGDNIKKPEVAAGGKPSQKKKKDEIKRYPSVLDDPEVRKQLEEMHPHKPYFMTTVTAIQVILLIVSMIINMIQNGSPIASLNDNVMFGPEGGV